MLALVGLALNGDRRMVVPSAVIVPGVVTVPGVVAVIRAGRTLL
jgi:hypothetical protein